MKLFKFLMVAILALSACTKKAQDNTPEGALDSYVTAAFNAKNISDRKRLAELTTGEALEYLNAMSDENFKKIFLDSGLRLQSFKAKDIRTENDGDVSLIYELSFKAGKTTTNTIHTAKKIAYITQKDGAVWKIRATKNIKTFIERKEDLVITPDTTSQEEATTDKK